MDGIQLKSAFNGSGRNNTTGSQANNTLNNSAERPYSG